jgi:hypothetical protein
MDGLINTDMQARHLFKTSAITKEKQRKSSPLAYYLHHPTGPPGMSRVSLSIQKQNLDSRPKPPLVQEG